MHKEKIATQREITRKLELENAITTAGVINRAELTKGFAELADALVGTVMNSDLPRSAKENFLNNLASWPKGLHAIKAGSLVVTRRVPSAKARNVSLCRNRLSGCYWLPGLAVGDGVAAGCGASFCRACIRGSSAGLT
jgi:hypothetical protein